jgi:hypothetical protein
VAAAGVVAAGMAAAGEGVEFGGAAGVGDLDGAGLLPGGVGVQAGGAGVRAGGAGVQAGGAGVRVGPGVEAGSGSQVGAGCGASGAAHVCSHLCDLEEPQARKRGVILPHDARAGIF